MPNHPFKQPKPLRLYRLILRLYPKSHRQSYGDQMMQTMQDMLDDQDDQISIFVVWLRVIAEAPKNVIEEHISNLEGKHMNQINTTAKKRNLVIMATTAAIITGIAIAFSISRNSTFHPTNLSKVQNTGTNISCVQAAKNTSLSIPQPESDFITNAAIIGIIDVPAGTNVDVFIKDYTDTKASGTLVYPDTYGSYNFTTSKQANKSSDGFTGGWSIDSLQACKK